MQVMLDIPGSLAAQITATGKDPARAALEALAVAAIGLAFFSKARSERC